MNNVINTIKDPATEPTADIDHLINHVAIIVRATKNEYGLNDEQKKKLFDKFSVIYDAYPKEISQRVLDAVDSDNIFWKPHSDTVLKYLYDAGILVDSLGI